MSEPFLNYLNHLTVDHLNPADQIHPNQVIWQDTMSVQDDEAVTQFYFLYFYLIVRGQTDLHDREHANADLRENLRELRRLMMEGTEEVEVRRARGIRIINLHEERVTRHFGFSMDGPEKKSEDEIRAEARAAELKKKGPVYGPPKPPEMA